jgi:hypothetical protein
MTMTAHFPLQEAPAGAPCNPPAWRRFFAIKGKGPTPRAEDAIAAYLRRHQEIYRRRYGSNSSAGAWFHKIAGPRPPSRVAVPRLPVDCAHSAST